jgi:hypothetical protein
MNKKQPEMPATNWAKIYVCPKGHFYNPEGKAHSSSVAWVMSFCHECSKEQYGRDWTPQQVERVYYTRDEWAEGQRKLETVARIINERYLGKVVNCDICNKVILNPKKDKAFHLQSHYSTAITENEAHHINAV